MRISSFTVGPFQENCWLLQDEASGEAVLIDPGDEGARLLLELERAKATLTAIWLTHAHLDHIGGIARVKAIWPDAPIHLHPADRPLYDRGAAQAARYGIPFESPPAPEVELAEGDLVSLGAERFEVWHLPGHAPGHVAFINETLCFGGDLLFAGSIGRTDLPGSEPAAMERSLTRMMTLSDAIVVHPGHGPRTTVGAERRGNPFLNGTALIPGR